MVALGCLLPVAYFAKGDLNAATGTTFTAPNFQLGDLVYYGNREKPHAVIIADAGNVSFVGDSENGKVNFAQAQEITKKMENDATTKAAAFGNIGKNYVWNIHLPYTADFGRLTVDNKITKIPSVDFWWLNDDISATYPNRAKFVGGPANDLAITAAHFNDTVINGTTCSTAVNKTPGVLVKATTQDPSVSKTIIEKKRTVQFSTVICSGAAYVYADVYESANCTGATLETGLSVMERSGGVCTTTETGLLIDPKNNIGNSSGGQFHAAIYRYLGVDFTNFNTAMSIPNFPSRLNVGTCINNLQNIAPGIARKNKNVGSMRITQRDLRGSITTSPNMRHTLLKTFEEETPVNCPGQSQTADIAAVRPVFNLQRAKVVLGNTSKRTINVANKLTQSIPASDGVAYLTMKNENLTVSLTTDAKGVKGNDLYTTVGDDGTVQIPVTLSGTVEGTKYVSAIATTKDGQKVYGTLGSVTGNSAVLSLDVSNLIDVDVDTGFDLALYPEDTGVRNTMFMGAEKEIHVYVTEQNIAFPENQNKNVTYGDSLRVEAKLDLNGGNDYSKQANTDITFSIVAPDGISADTIASLENATYDANTGTASVNVKPKSGTGTITLAINKAGGDGYPDAEQKTLEIALAKKDITLTAEVPSGTFKVGDTAPSFTYTASFDVSTIGDAIPSVLQVEPTPIAPTTEASPFADGKVAYAGSWGLNFNSQSLSGNDADMQSFTKKYNVSLVDYQSNPDSTKIFKTIANAEGWIEVSPSANNAGWHHETIHIKPSTTAKNAGYTHIAFVQNNVAGAFQEELTYDTETTASGNKLSVQLKNANGDVTNVVETDLIKLDKTAPVLEHITIENESKWMNTSKKVTFSFKDTLSGYEKIEISENTTTYQVSSEGNDTYSFMADHNGAYSVTGYDIAGNTIKKTINVGAIDTTVPSVSAVASNVVGQVLTQDINVNYIVGASGIKNFDVYFKAPSGTEFEKKDTLHVDADTNTAVYVADMNGFYQFVVENQVLDADGKGIQATSNTVEITQINPPNPVTRISAKKKDGSVYSDNTWVNQDVSLSFANINTEISDECSFEVRKGENGTWTKISGASYPITVSDDAYEDETYYVRATSTKNAVEVNPKSIHVKIDKETPTKPTIDQEEDFTTSNWYASSPQTISGILTPKISQIPQKMQVRKSSSSTWEDTQSLTYEVDEEGSQTLYFRTMDAAGNVSDETSAVVVQIDTTLPSIEIQLNENTLQYWLNTLTFGLFFKDTLQVDLVTSFGVSGGDVYYIMREEESSIPPSADDPDWTSGDSFRIEPDKKGIIYAKAVSKAGKTTIISSLDSVVVDHTDPIITPPSDMTSWTNENTITIDVEDELAGLDEQSFQYSTNNASDIKGTIMQGKVTLQNLPDGEYRIPLSVDDKSGNKNHTSSVKVMIDTQAPLLSDISTSVNGWTSQRVITFHVSDSLSGIASKYPVVEDANHKKVTLTDLGNGNYSFVSNINTTYTISAKDQAGNETQETYVEAYIDADKPVIENIEVADEDIYKPSKKVTFTITETGSGVNEVAVYYMLDGTQHDMSVEEPSTGTTYSFIANENARYVIHACDIAQNCSEDKTVEVTKIDATGTKITNISPMQTWVKDERTVSFTLQHGNIALDSGYPSVTCGGTKQDITEISTDVYTFKTSQNGLVCTIEAKSAADNDVVKQQVTIKNIDTMAPMIYDISDNVTSTTWRDPITVTFHAEDFNDTEKISKGSGMKVNYPSVTYKKGEQDVPVSVRADAQTPSMYSFVASKNTTYTIHAIDQAGHDEVLVDVTVDHIVQNGDIQQLRVQASNEDGPVSSNTWTKGTVTFALSGGWLHETQRFEVAQMEAGARPSNEDFEEVNDPQNKQHHVRGNIENGIFYFRVTPDVSTLTQAGPFIIHLDNEKPTKPEITVTQREPNALQRFFNQLTFQGWQNKGLDVSFSASDNLTTKEQLQYLYCEGTSEECTNWKRTTKPLSYDENTNMVLYVKAVDLAGNEGDSALQKIMIDHNAPSIHGVLNQKVYKQYYTPRYITYEDNESGIQKALYSITNSDHDLSDEPLMNGTKVLGEGSYHIQVWDEAGNETEVRFIIVPLPDITDIDGGDEDRSIIEQVEKELAEVKEHLDPNEKKNYEDWIHDANEQWNQARIDKLRDEETEISIEGVDGTTFDPKLELVVEETKIEEVPDIQEDIVKSYRVQLRRGAFFEQPKGSVKVTIPYTGDGDITLYEVGEDGTITKIPFTKDAAGLSFVTNELKHYLIGEKKQEDPNKDGNVCVVGPDNTSDTKDDVCGSKDSIKNEDGSIDVPDGGKVIFPDKEIEVPDGAHIDKDGNVTLPDGTILDPDGNKKKDPNVDKDTNQDGKPDINIDLDSDGKADINVDINNDGNPDVNIDTDGDGKPDYNIDVDGDGRPDVNVGPIQEPWKPDLCVKVKKKEYCTSTYKKVYLNEDTDGDGKPDINLDLNYDKKADLNIDTNGDKIPDLDIDSAGDTAGSPPDGKADINVDDEHDGTADRHILTLDTWKPEKDVTIHGFTYDTMAGLTSDKNREEKPKEPSKPSDATKPDTDDTSTKQTIIKKESSSSGTGGARTGDTTANVIYVILLVLGSGSVLYHMKKKYKVIR